MSGNGEMDSSTARFAIYPRFVMATFPRIIPCIMIFALALAVRGLAARPNIVLVMTDDQGYGDLGITGNPVLETPHIDSFARQSASMSRFYVSPVCSPTRACLMTGRYNYRTRVIDTFKGRSMMEPNEVTIAEVLHTAGYRTGVFGKWHLGDNYPLRAQDQGFDESLVLRGGGLAQPSEPIENHEHYTDPILFHNGEQVQTKGYCTDVYFDAALKFIESAQQAQRPFFVYIATNAPHGPFHDVPEELYQKYRAKDLTPALLGNAKSADTVARVYAMIENIDQNVGRLTAALDRLGLAENTIVIFMVDNGPNTRRYVGPFRGMKSDVHEGGIRSPFFVRWPARFTAGTVSDRLAAHIDVMPTLLEAADVPAPAEVKLDGRSLLPLLEGKSVAWPERTIVLQTHRGNQPMRFHHAATIQQRWKLVHPTGFGREAMPADVPFELYDLEADPGETRNLAAENPDEVQALKDAYEKWFEDVSSTRPDNYAPPRIIAGSSFQPTTFLSQQDWRVGDNEAGWGSGGRWMLKFERDANYDVQLRWRKPIAPGQIELRVGGISRKLDLSEPSDVVRLENVLIPTGDAELTLDVRRGNEHGDAYQIYLERR